MVAIGFVALPIAVRSIPASTAGYRDTGITNEIP